MGRLNASLLLEEADAAAAGSKAQKSKKGGKKQKAAFWQDGAVKADSEDAHLCLSTWRSQLVANAPVVFAPCVPTAAQQFATIDAAKGAKRLRLGTEDDNLCVGVGAFILGSMSRTRDSAAAVADASTSS